MRQGSGVRGHGSAAIAALIATVGVACTGRPDRIVVEPKEETLLAQGASFQLKATPVDDKGKALAGFKVSFASRQPAVAKVSSSGLVTAVKSGTTVIVASAGGASGEAQVRVAIPFAISMVPDELMLVGLGARGELYATVKDEQGQSVPGAAPKWGNEDPGIVQVEGGKVVAVGVGTAHVSATAAGIRARATIHVEQPPFESLRPDVRRISLKSGESQRIAVKALDVAGATVPGVALGYEPEDPKIVTVDSSGKVTGVARGKSRVVVSAGSRRAEVEVEVRK